MLFVDNEFKQCKKVIMYRIMCVQLSRYEVIKVSYFICVDNNKKN